MDYFSEKKDLYSTIFTALKNLGVKVPKIKNFKSCMPKQDKNTLPKEPKMFAISLYKQEWTYDADYPLPKFLAISTTYLENFSRTVGLFRKSGSITRQRTLRVKLESGGGLEGSDANDVASLLKQWLRELPESLIPQYLHDLFIRCQQLNNPKDRISACHLSCLLLPPEHLHPLKHLLCFLKELTMHSSENQMGAQNFALMMAPNIFTTKTESITKTCNHLVPLHVAVIRLLIENAERVGEIPQSVSLHYLAPDGRSSELDSQANILDFSPSKLSRKLKSGPVQDIFSGIRKLVGQNTIPASNLKTLTPEKCWSSPKIACGPVLLNDAEKTFSTLNNEDMQALIKPRIGTNRVRRKSFGLLRRKDRKRQKSNKTSSQTKRNLAASRSSNLNSDTSTERMGASIKVPTTPNESERKSPRQSDYDGLKYESIAMYSSGCGTSTATKEFNLSTATSPSCLQNGSQTASYWLQSKDKTKQFETWKSGSFHLNASNNIKQSKTASVAECLAVKLEQFDKLEMSSPNHDVESYNQRHSLSSEISSSTDPQVNNCTEISLTKFDSNESKSKLQKSNRRNVDSSSKVNLSQRNFKKDFDNTFKSKQTYPNSSSDVCKSSKKNNENNVLNTAKIRREALVKPQNKEKNIAHQMRSMDNCKNNENHVDLLRSKSSLTDSNNKTEGTGKNNVKVPKKTTRQSSLIRGKPNTIKSGLPSQHLNKTPITTQNLEINNKKLINQNESNTTSLKIKPNRDVSPKESGKYFSEQDISLILNSASLNLSSLSVNTPERKPFASSVPKSTTPQRDTSYEITSKNEGQSCFKSISSHSDSKIPKLRPSHGTNQKNLSPTLSGSKRKTPTLRLSGSVRSSGHSRIPLLSKEKLSFSDIETSLNDSCFQTPNKTLFNSPNSILWMSGNKYLSMNSPQDDSFSKRESISLILKNNPGHVQAKVQLYDSRVKIDSTTTVEENETWKVSPCGHDIPIRSFSQKQLSNSKKNRKPISVSQSYDSSSKRLSGKILVKTPLKLPQLPSEFSIDSGTLTPNISHPLKEVTNLKLGISGKQTPTCNTTPVKDDNEIQTCLTTSRRKCCNTDLNKKKLKRNSFSGCTPLKLSKRVSRSESSPSCLRPGNRLFKVIQESTCNSPSITLELNLHSSLSPTHSFSNPSATRAGSFINIEKLNCDEMVDEWQCEF